MTESNLAGRRVLIVEDEMVLAMALEDMLDLMGCEVAKSPRVPDALERIEAGGIDIALLDLNLDGERSYAVAEALDAGGIPFAFMTGYHRDDLRPEWRERPVLQKPFVVEDLEQVMEGALTA
jgi:CheY-like chemotaxis protein